MTTADGVEVAEDATVYRVVGLPYAPVVMATKVLWTSELISECHSTREAAIRAAIEHEQQAHEARMGRLRAMLGED